MNLLNLLKTKKIVHQQKQTKVIKTECFTGRMFVTSVLDKSMLFQFSLKTRLESKSFEPLINFLAFLVLKIMA